jgi:hypothetical protein
MNTTKWAFRLFPHPFHRISLASGDAFAKQREKASHLFRFFVIVPSALAYVSHTLASSGFRNRAPFESVFAS